MARRGRAYNPPVLYEKLLEYKRRKQLVGFCQWADGDGLLFGFVKEVSRSTVQFALIDPLGRDDGGTRISLEFIFRLEESSEYVRRLSMFREVTVRDAKGSTTRQGPIIHKRLREACVSGECVDLMLLGDPRRECRILAVDDEYCEFEEHCDDPLKPVARRLVQLSQIQRLKWRSSMHLAVSAVWAGQSVTV